MHLGEAKRLSDSELARLINIEDVSEVRRKMGYWVAKGVAKVTTTTSLQDEAEAKGFEKSSRYNEVGVEEALWYEVVESQAHNIAAELTSEGLEDEEAVTLFFFTFCRLHISFFLFSHIKKAFKFF